MSTVPDPVRHRLQVPLSVQQAFDLFVHDMARWWPFKSHSCAADQACDVHFVPRVGGAVTELTRSGARHPWGTLTDWDPPSHFAMTWHPAQSAHLATRLSVRFSSSEGGCLIELQHDGWAARDAGAGTVRDEYQQGWAHVLGLFAAAAAQGAT